MANFVSPGINISEVDKTLAVGAVALTEGAIAGHFTWGPVDVPRTITSEEELVKAFGKPDANSADYFFTAANFLAYSSVLRTVRVVNPDSGRAATAEADSAVLSATAIFSINTSSNILIAVSGNTSALFSGQTLVVANSTVAEQVTIASVANTEAAILTAVPTVAVTNANAYSYGVYVKNDEHYNETFADGSASVGQWAAKYVGTLGNSLRIEVCGSVNAYAQTFAQSSINATAVLGNTAIAFSANVAGYFQTGDYLISGSEEREVTSIAANGTVLSIATAFSAALAGSEVGRRWRYSRLFGAAPGTSTYAQARGGSGDEVHIVVVDARGLFTGAANTVLERYEFLSKASDAKADNGANNYYKDVLNRRSPYVWWFDHPDSTNWGAVATGTTFDVPNLVQGDSLFGGTDGGNIASADVQRGYDLFRDELIETSLVLGGPSDAALANYIITNVIEAKPYTMGFFSPAREDVVDNAGSEVTDAVAYRNSLPSTSYAVLDSGWKYQYDKYNDVYRYVPLNGDTAGCAVRADQVAESWYSPAGFSRGQIKNVVKLAFNPRQADRDDLYRNGINPIVSFPGQGTVLFGDKTLLAKPSAFDRIGVRRLFIALEKTIERSAKQQLFEQNDAFTRQAFVAMVEPYLRSVRGRRGILEYAVICDETNNPPDAVDRGEFRADIYVKAIKSINFVALQFVAVRSDVSFAEVQTTLQ